MNKKIDPRSITLQSFLDSGRPIPLAFRSQIAPLLHHMDGLTPTQRDALLVKTTPEHKAMLAHLTERLGRPVRRVNPLLLKVLKDVTL